MRVQLIICSICAQPCNAACVFSCYYAAYVHSRVMPHVYSADIMQHMSGCQPTSSKINEWMASNRLKLNPTKTELIWLGSPQRLQHCPVGELQIAGVGIKPTTYARDLGATIDIDLPLQCHVNHVTRTCFYHLRHLRVIRRSLTVDTAHSLVRALVHSRLDYCNGVLPGMHQYQYERLQSVLRAAARLVLRLPKWASVSRPCTRNSTGSLIQKWSSSNYVAPSTSVCTTVRRSTWLNYVYRSPRSRDVVICDRLHTATSSYRRRLLRPFPLVDFFMLAQWPGTVYSLFLRTHLYSSQCLRNCWKQNCSTEFRSQLHALLWRFV